MAVNLSPVGGVAAQFFTNTGAVLTGGKLYTYSAGTTTPAVTYTTSNGSTAQPNPIVLDAAGRVPNSGEIWLTDGINYKFVLKDSNDVLIATYDNVSGINSNFVAYTNSQQIITATAGQTVFNLSISYAPGTNSLSVFVDGVNQYGSNAQYAYIETSSTSVTFTSGLHVGALVKFTTAQQQGAGVTNASQISYIPAGTNAVATNVQDKLRQTVSVMDFGAVGNGVVDDKTAIQNAINSISGTGELYFPVGTYLINSNLNIGSGAVLNFAAGAVIKIPNGVALNLDSVNILAGRSQIFNCVGTGVVTGFSRNSVIYPEWWGATTSFIPASFATRLAIGNVNTPAMQAALDFAGYNYSAQGYCGTVELTAGFYITTSTLNIPLSVNLIGVGIESAIFYNAPTGNAVSMVSTNNSLVSDIFIAPLAGATWNFSTGYGLYMNGVSTPIVRNVWSSGFGGGSFYIQSVIEGRFYGLISDNSNGPAFTIRGVEQGTIFENCVSANPTGVSFDISGYDCVLLGCTAEGGANATYGFYLNTCENINLIGCAAYNSNYDGFFVSSSSINSNLTNCIANNPGLLSSGTYNGYTVGGARIKLTACKTTANTPLYGYGLYFASTAIDCATINGLYAAGTSGSIFDAQTIGSNTYPLAKVTTTNTTPVAIWSKFFSNNMGAVLEATVVAKQRIPTANKAVYKFWAYVSTDSTATVINSGPTSIYSYESTAGLDATFVLTTATGNGGVVSLQVTGLSGDSVDWEAVVDVISVTG